MGAQAGCGCSSCGGANGKTVSPEAICATSELPRRRRTRRVRTARAAVIASSIGGDERRATLAPPALEPLVLPGANREPAGGAGGRGGRRARPGPRDHGLLRPEPPALTPPLHPALEAGATRGLRLPPPMSGMPEATPPPFVPQRRRR